MAQSTAILASVKAAHEKPPKPYPEFPLTPHGSGHWAKKIRGRLHYFGAWGRRVDGRLTRFEDDGWEAALATYEEQANDLHAGRTKKPKTDGLTVGELCDRFLQAKEQLRDNGELSPRTWQSYKATTDRVVRVFGKKRLVSDLSADDFGKLRDDIATTRGPVALGTEVQRVRTVFRFGYDEGLMDRPMRYGQQFSKPSKTVLRKARAAKGDRMLEPAELRTLIDSTSPQLKAMVLLALNAGLGNTDCSSLTADALNLEKGWLNYPREKTGVDRRAKLWAETIAALRVVLSHPKKAKSTDDANLVFLTKYGQRWITLNKKGTPSDAITQEFRKLLDDTKLYRPGRSFYSLHHIFRTVADAARDFPAVRLVMGHADSSIDGVYRERIDDHRLEAVAEHVHGWLFPAQKNPRKASRRKKTEQARAAG